MSDFLAEMAASSGVRASALAAGAGTLFTLAERSAAPLPIVLGDFGVIAEIKPRAPSAGALASGDVASATARASAYADGGAACVSVLTEPSRFDGSLDHLAAVARALRPRAVPVMRKDFLVDPLQIAEARLAGASGVLLVARMLDDARLREMLEAARALGMFVLLEAFDEDDLARCRDHGPSVLVGVNSRDLRTLAIDRGRLTRLAARLPAGAAAIAESGIESAADAADARRAGYRGVLVGTALMRATDPAASVRALRDTEATPCT